MLFSFQPEFQRHLDEEFATIVQEIELTECDRRNKGFHGQNAVKLS